MGEASKESGPLAGVIFFESLRDEVGPEAEWIELKYKSGLGRE